MRSSGCRTGYWSCSKDESSRTSRQGKADEHNVGLLMAGRGRKPDEPFLQHAETRRLPPAHSAGGARNRLRRIGRSRAHLGLRPRSAQRLSEIVSGSLSPEALPNTLNWAVPLVGMTLVAAIPLRGGMINLGGDGQLVIGGLVGALGAALSPGDTALRRRGRTGAARNSAAGLYAALAAWGEMRHGVPMLISSLLLSYPAIGVTSYLARFPLRDISTGLPQTSMIPPDARLYVLSGALNVGSFLIAAIALAVVFVDRRTSAGYELRMRGKNPRFAGYGGVRLGWQAVQDHVRERRDRRPRRGDHRAWLAIPIHRRSALTPAYTWSGLMAALLVSGEPVGAIVAGLFFAALQTGGFAMQRETSVPRVLTLVLQAIMILFLAIRRGWAADVIESIFTPFLFQSAAQAITPILFAALAGVLCGRVGVFNLALEGQMLIGAFAAIVGSYFGHSAFVGVVAAMAAAGVFSLILGYGATIFRGDPVVIGIGMNLLASGLTAYLLRVVFGVSGTFSDPNVVGLGRITIPALVGVPVLGWAFARQSALTLAVWAVTVLISVILFLTPVGLRLRGVGEQPDAAGALGIDVVALPDRNSARRRRAYRSRRGAAVARRGQHVCRRHERGPRMDRRRRGHAWSQQSALRRSGLCAVRLRRCDQGEPAEPRPP